MSVMRIPSVEEGYLYNDYYRGSPANRRPRSATRSISTIGTSHNFAAIAAAAMNYSSQSLEYQTQHNGYEGDYAHGYSRSPAHHQRSNYQYSGGMPPGSPPVSAQAPQQSGYYSPTPSKRNGANFYWTARVGLF